jgi:hypothetical protein
MGRGSSISVKMDRLKVDGTERHVSLFSVFFLVAFY